MKIGIDARMFGPKWGGGGLGRYVEELINELQALDQKNRYVLFLKPENAEACKITNPHVEKRIVSAHWYTLKEQILLPKAIKDSGVDIMHFLHWNVPLACPVPFIVTIHDLILLEDPKSAKATTLGPIRYALKRAGFKQVLSHAIKKSQKIIAVSEYTKSSILKHFSIPKEKIQVIYEGVSKLDESITPTNSLDSKFQFPPSPFFLYVGSAYPHKNLESLLHAFSFFVKSHPETKLVLVGKDDLFYQKLKKEVDEIEIPKNTVIFTGFIPDQVMSELYNKTALYLFPSFIEGFGLPPLEAMRYGAPVAAAKKTALPEVLGDAALYFDPDNIEQMVEVMEKAITDQTLMSAMKQKGEARAKNYSWKSMAEETKNLYERNGS